jgi:hypothetical protein
MQRCSCSSPIAPAGSLLITALGTLLVLFLLGWFR